MILRPAKLTDYKELVGMFKELIETVYTEFEIGEDIFFYGTVQQWFQLNRDVIVCEDEDGAITGFSVCYVEDIGIVKPYYYGDLLYVKPKFRNGRSSYMLYNNIVTYAEKMGLPLLAKAFVEEGNNNNKIQKRWGKQRFIEYHRGVNNG